MYMFWGISSPSLVDKWCCMKSPKKPIVKKAAGINACSVAERKQMTLLSIVIASVLSWSCWSVPVACDVLDYTPQGLLDSQESNPLNNALVTSNFQLFAFLEPPACS